MTSSFPATIHLYTAQSPNGIKISILLAELNLPYILHTINISRNENKTAEFHAINPNGRIPALTDILPDGEEVRIFESGSIMQYLVDRYDTDFLVSYPRHTREHIEMTSWLFFQNAGVGPMQGQANHFFRYSAGSPIPYAIARYQTETRRLYAVLEQHLADAGTEYVVGDKCTIADIALWGWVTRAKWALGGGEAEGEPLDEFPVLKKWEERMFARPGVQKGRQVPEKHHRELLRDAQAMRAFEERGRAFYRKLAEEKEREERVGDGLVKTA